MVISKPQLSEPQQAQNPPQVQEQQPEAPQFAPANVNNNNNGMEVDEEPKSVVYLILKLAVMVYILSSGKSSMRLFFLSVGALIIFLYQTGKLDHLFRSISQWNAFNVPVTARAEGGMWTGLIREVFGFFGPLVCSIFPTWAPQVPPRPQAIPPVGDAVPEDQALVQ